MALDRGVQTTIIVTAVTAVTVAVAIVKEVRAERRARRFHKLIRRQYWTNYADAMHDRGDGGAGVPAQ